MKKILFLTTFAFSFNTFACPNISGSFFDSDAEMVKTISQDGCVSTTWSDDDGKTTLIADHVERVLETDGKMTAYAKVSFTDTEFIIDIRMDWADNNEYDLPVRWITSYRVDKYNNLVEKIRPFKADGSESSTDYVTFRRVK
ncbi:MAG: hypothetical protein K2Q18_03345 [Bdellovibrionales bacterium]|nr:hypothetical protein [Bdellovibrionales bacterium]